MKITRKSDNALIADNVKVANNVITRFIGLLNRSGLEKGEGLLITPCNSIHSFGMRFNFDAVFINKNNQIKHLMTNIKPWSVSPIIFSVKSVLELPGGTIKELKLNVGDFLVF